MFYKSTDELPLPSSMPFREQEYANYVRWRARYATSVPPSTLEEFDLVAWLHSSGKAAQLKADTLAYERYVEDALSGPAGRIMNRELWQDGLNHSAFASAPYTPASLLAAQSHADNEVTNPKDAAGAKKCRLDNIPFSAVAICAPVFQHGADKYGRFNWRAKKIGHSAYIAAAMRHLMADADGETIDPESGQSHVAHAVAGLMILLDAKSCGSCVDDRVTPGMTADIMRVQSKL